MDFSGPEHCDLQDVQSINLAFTTVLRSAAGTPIRENLPQKLQPAVQALSARQLERLSGVPFLLLSLGEWHDSCWSQTTQGRPIRDLFVPQRDVTDPVTRIATATAGFLWQLARKNLYAARVVSGATLGWCEQLAEQPMLRVLEYATGEQPLLTPRLANDTAFWHRLLGAGVSSELEIRRAAHMSALQSVLNSAAVAPTRRLQTAACYSSVPSMELRESARSKT